MIGGLTALALALLAAALLVALKTARTSGAPLDLPSALHAVLSPVGVADWIQVVGIVVIAAFAGLLTAAAAAARRSAS
jgi:hypothetical protein